MEQVRCQKCNHRLLDIEAVKYRIKIRCRHCKSWCSFESRISAYEQEPKSVISNAETK